MNSNSQPALRLNAYVTTEYDHKVGAGHPSHFEFNAVLASLADAQAFAAQFPKGAKVGACRLNSAEGEKGYVFSQGHLVSDGVNAGVNEAGLKRYATILKAAAKLGIEIEYVKNAGNCYETREAFEAAIA